MRSWRESLAVSIARMFRARQRVAQEFRDRVAPAQIVGSITPIRPVKDAPIVITGYGFKDVTRVTMGGESVEIVRAPWWHRLLGWLLRRPVLTTTNRQLVVRNKR